MGGRRRGVGWSVVLVVALAGCSSPPLLEGDEEPPAATARVELAMNPDYTGPEAETTWWRALYEVDARLGEVEAGPINACGITPAAGGAAPLTVRLHNLLDEVADDEFATPIPQFDVELLGDVDRLVWVDPWGGCAEQLSADLLDAGRRWQYLDTVTLEGYLVGVPVEDPSGAGVDLRFEDGALAYRSGEPVTVSLLY